MTSYTWNTQGGGAFGDASNWYNDSDMQNNDGSPGAGDSATIDDTNGIVTASGESVANLNAVATHIVGSIDVTGLLTDGYFSGGSDTFGTAESSTFEGGTIQADTLLQCYFTAGTVTADVLDSGYVQGAAVTVQSIERVGLGEYDGDDYLTVSSGSLNSMTMDLVGPTGDTGADYFEISGGTATISGEATASGMDIEIAAMGGILKFETTLTLSDGAALEGSEGGKTKVQTLVVGDSGDDSLVDLTGAGTTLNVSGNVDAGGDGEGTGDFTVAKGAAMTVAGNVTLGEYEGGSSTLTLTGGATVVTIDGNLTIGDEGSATLIVENGATLNVEGEMIIGDQGVSGGADNRTNANVVSFLKLTGAGKLVSQQDYIVGDNEYGELYVLAGFALKAGYHAIVLGYQSQGDGNLTVSGAGSKIGAAVVYVGVDGSGQFEVLDDASAYVLKLVVGSGSGSTLADVTVSYATLHAETLKFGAGAANDMTVEKSGQVVIDKTLIETTTKASLTISTNSSATIGSADVRSGFLSIGFGGEADLRGNFSGLIAIDGGTLNLDAAGAGGTGTLHFAQGILNVASGVALTNTIGNFNTNDTINLSDVTVNKDSYANGVLSLFEGKSLVTQIHLAGTYDPSSFHVATSMFTDVTTITYGKS